MTQNLPPESNHSEDKLIADCLDLLDQDAAPYQEQIAGRVQKMVGELFLESHAASNVKTADVEKPSLHPRGRNMIAKSLVALSALLGMLAWFAGHDSADADVTLGQVLKETTAAKSLHFTITQDGKTKNVWVKFPGLIRWENSPTEYRIAHGSQLWQIDEETNTYRAGTADWFDESAGRLDLLSLIGLKGAEAARFRQARPAGEVVHRGKHCRVFRIATRDQDRPLVVEAIAESATGELQTLAVWPKDKRHGAPLAELALIARGPAVEEEKFLVAKSLSEDGRIGKLTDSQGVVTLRPVLGRRWTPVCRQMLVKPGDWLRTDVRGANAATAALTSGYKIIAGPGTLVELITPHQLRIHGGEIQITGDAKAEKPLELLGPKDKTKSVAIGKSVHYRIDRAGEFQELKQKPLWLAGYEGSTTNDSLGSLIAKIDGRDVPLSVGYHKVSVEIRDQIARTTIEESFINRTDGTLEGQFHFPLPQDASISGFGMWIGGELIEADVVEKQRAREIYETILREKRDPGLLEWTGGNIFKARVYPIPARSEKRIRIVYTQVLPLRGNQYRYSYGLRSELLRKTPLRDLSLDVQIHSALPIKSVNCPTHPARTQLAGHSAKLEFTAQEYTPERDFEIVCEVDSRKSDVVVIPHQRGEDGYFLVQLTPPGPEGNWQREILPDGNPLNLLVVCDTSASMDSEKRRQQAEFVGSLLASLGPKDQFNLAACDVNCEWFSKEMLSAGDKVEQAQDWLGKRISLGWTDLDKMMESVLKRLSPETHVIYVGDGIVTAGFADPQEFVGRLKRMTEGARKGTFHAVSVGNSFESTVLKALSRVGGGSLRQIGGEQTPQRMAFELLNEIAQPSLRDLKVEFRGLKVAAVYPEKLPNLASGTQRILIGRYLPTGENQTGEIIITGQQNGERKRFASRMTLAGAESGNSFIPRLWARAHLDHLLAQGKTPFIKDEIIALSEEFHIITPFTSLLVLESDEDRERFGVKRRYQMRDGERFFAEGKSQSQMELLQQQMKRAGDWRLNLRRQILARLARLGRDTRIFGRLEQLATGDGLRFASSNGPVSKSTILSGIGGAGRQVSEFGLELDGEHALFFDSEGREDNLSGFEPHAASTLEATREEFLGELDVDAILGDRLELDFKSLEDRASTEGFKQPNSVNGLFDLSLNGEWKEAGLLASNKPLDIFERGSGRIQMENAPYGQRSSIQWFQQLFPNVPNPSPKTAKPPVKWKGEALAISRSLIQPLGVKTGGIEVRRNTEFRDPIWKRVTSHSEQVELYAPKRWLSFSTSASSQTYVAWATPEERGMASRAFQLGRVRRSVPRDWESFTPGQRPYAETGLHETFREYEAQIQKPADDRAVLTLTSRHQPDSQTLLTIDTNRNVILEIESRYEGKTQSRTKYSNFVKAASVWWPGKIETFDETSRVTSIVTQKIQVHTDDAFSKRFAAEQPGKDEYRLVKQFLPALREAQKAVAAGSASFDDRLVLLLRSSLIQQWDEVLEQLQEMERLAPNQAGISWIRAGVLISARKNDDARKLLETLADRLVQQKPQDEYFLAGHLLDQVSQISDYNEILAMLERVRPVFQRQPTEVAGERNWTSRRAQSLRALGRTEEVLELQKSLAESAPWDVYAQTTYARDLANTGDYESAYKWLRTELDRNSERQDYETRQLRESYAQFLREQGRNQEVIAFFEEWIETEPESENAYQQYLAALIMGDRSDDANETAKAWLMEGRIEGKLAAAALARFYAAVNFGLGQRYSIYMDWIDPIWLKPLEETAIYFLEHKHHPDVASRIIDSYRFHETDENDRVKAEAARRLKLGVATMSPADLNRFVGWTLHVKDLEQADWAAIADTIKGRWDREQDQADRHSLGDVLAQIHTAHFADSRRLPFLRERIARAVKEKETRHAASQRQILFDALIRQDWQAEHEAEAFALIEELTYSRNWGLAEPGAAGELFVRVGALHRFVDAMLQSRYDADLKQLQDQGHPEKLTRTDLAKKKSEFQKIAKEGVAKRLADRLKTGPRADSNMESTEYLSWVRLERMYLDLRLDRHHANVAKETWEILGERPPAAEDDPGPPFDENQAEAARMKLLEGLRQKRAFEMANYLAARKSADKELVNRLKEYIAAGVAFEGDEAAAWKRAQFGLLIVLDEPDALDKQLTDWIQEDPFPATWQLALARLRAERGKLEDAIRLLETVRKATPLSPADLSALGDWYLVVDRKDDYRQAKIDVFKFMGEYQISRWIRNKRVPWSRTDSPLPEEMDERVLFAFQALFEKSNQPQNYVYELREFYTASRDFRLLNMVPDALLGRTPQQIYPFLKSLRTNLLDEIRKESTADEILARVNEIRAACESPVDHRALDLLEALIERQASEVLNQPGPHTEAAVKALRRAFQRDWADGEVRQMADFLDSLGTIRQPGLSDERLRQLRELHNLTKPGTDDRLFVAWHLAHALFYSHNQRDEALAVMEIARREYQETHPEGWPAHANTPLDGSLSLLEAAKRFATAEDILSAQIEKPATIGQKWWMTNRRNVCYHGALRQGGRVSLGEGETLYRNLRDHLLRQLKAVPDENHRYQTVSRLLDVFRTAKEKSFEFEQDLRQFAFEELPVLLKTQTNNYHYLVERTGETLNDLIGPRLGLEFLIDRYENYPERYRYDWQNPWQRLAGDMADYWEAADRKIGELEPRLLNIVLAELRRDLTTRYGRSRYFYHDDNSHYWEAKADDFARVAEDVLKEREGSGRSAVYIATYLFDGLDRKTRAIEILHVAHDKKLLNLSQQITFCDFLDRADRHPESIPILQPIVKENPDVMSYRTRLITAYHKSKRPQQMRELLADTDAHFRKKGRWTESNIASLAQNCLDNELFAEAVKYYGEVIPLHERTAPNRGIGGHALSAYYGNMALAYSGLGQTKDAVDAAAAGVIAWGPRHSERQNSLSILERVLADAKDLDAYVKSQDEQVKKEKQDSPLIRQKLGQVYAKRKQYEKAITQLQTALALQPTNVEIHQELIKAYDAVNDEKNAIRQTLALLDVDRHNLEEYKKLANRLSKDEVLGERAVTTIVEAAPNEAEHHQALAELRQSQNRWGEAITHWKAVAELRALEPNGLLNLAAAQIHEERFKDAQVSIDKLNRTEWPARFGSLRGKIGELEAKIPESK